LPYFSYEAHDLFNLRGLEHASETKLFCEFIAGQCISSTFAGP
jgi:hypothetical protein